MGPVGPYSGSRVDRSPDTFPRAERPAVAFVRGPPRLQRRSRAGIAPASCSTPRVKRLRKVARSIRKLRGRSSGGRSSRQSCRSRSPCAPLTSPFFAQLTHARRGSRPQPKAFVNAHFLTPHAQFRHEIRGPGGLPSCPGAINRFFACVTFCMDWHVTVLCALEYPRGL